MVSKTGIFKAGVYGMVAGALINVSGNLVEDIYYKPRKLEVPKIINYTQDAGRALMGISIGIIPLGYYRINNFKDKKKSLEEDLTQTR
jgi:hypothetical protein